MADILDLTPPRAIDANGEALPGALAYFYQSGTTEPVTVYADAALSVPLEWPVEADDAGVWPRAYHAGVALRVVATDAQGVTLPGFPLDPVAKIGDGTAAAAGISFNPTGPIPETDVQAAIERVQANIVAPLADFGLGVTGTAGLLTNFDATGTASGFYRFSNSTAGPRPSGWVNSNEGVVAVLRYDADDLIQFAARLNADEWWWRRLSAGSWSTWVPLYLAWASQTEARDGVNTTRAMNPVRTKQAISWQVPDIVRGIALGTGAQTWQNVTGSRLAGTIYQNTTGRPIEVAIRGTSGSPNAFQVSPDGTTWVDTAGLGSAPGGFAVTVPDTWRYRIGAGASLTSWAELR